MLFFYIKESGWFKSGQLFNPNSYPVAKDTLECPIHLSAADFHSPEAVQVYQDWKQWNIRHFQPPNAEKKENNYMTIQHVDYSYIFWFSKIINIMINTYFKCFCCCFYTTGRRLLWIFIHSKRGTLHRENIIFRQNLNCI